MNVSHMTSKVLAILALFLFSTSSLHADLIIEVKNAQVIVNNLGYVDVLIYSTNTDKLSIFGYEFQISTNTANSQLRFQALQGFAGNVIDDYVFPSDAEALGTLIRTVLREYLAETSCRLMQMESSQVLT